MVPIFQDTPWLGGDQDGYPLVPFENYLELRQGQRLSQDHPEIYPHSSREDLADLQCLLTFGLLEAVMEVKIAEDKLLGLDSSGEKVLTSEYLPDLLLDYRQRIRQLQDYDRGAGGEWASRIVATFTQVRNIVFTETFKGGNSAFLLAGLEPQVLADIIIQMGSIAEAVIYSTVWAFDPELFPHSETLGIMYMLYLVPYQHRTAMFANGWCPFIVDTISLRSPCVLGYAGTLRSPHSRASEGHAACMPASCVMNRIDSSDVAAKHVDEFCKCQNYAPSLSAVKDFLQDDKIPVVELCPARHDGLSLMDSSNTPFVAISHVWADGLRSTTEKGLPACQIERIAKMTSSLGGAFWIDTLCIPAIEDIRARAIGLMARTYREAKAVLVIDSGIREISSSAPREEKLFHVLSSRWMQRLWTFQEAVLAKKLYFEFLGALVSLDELLAVDTLPEKERFNPVLMSLLGDIETAIRGLKSSIDYNYGLNDVAAILRRRHTSRQSDETLAVRGVLNLDAFELATISDPEERMQTFLLRIENLSSSIIFLTRAPKMDKVGFRWAPTTFMGGAMVYLGNRCDALCTSTGLEAEYQVIFQDTVIGGEKDEWYISLSSEGCLCTYEIRDMEPRSSSAACNAILLMEGLRASKLEAIPCAGVWVDPEHVDRGGGGDRILCEFMRTLSLRTVVGTELSELENSHTVINVKFVERMKVKVT